MEVKTGTWTEKKGLAQMLKGGVIMDVVTAEHAKIAEDAGACAVMALERVPADIRKEGGVARMASISKIREIMASVSIPVMAKVRIGHFTEARVLEKLGVDYIDESEVLTPADEEHHVDKRAFSVPFVCGARNLGEALRRIAEGAAMITGCELKVTERDTPYAERRPSYVLGRKYVANMETVGLDMTNQARGRTWASTDFGNVSHRVPAALVGVGRPGGWAFHSDEGATQFATPAGVDCAVETATVLALAAVRLTAPA